MISKAHAPPVDIEVKNKNQRFGIEFGIVALGAKHKHGDENFAGASPFQRVQGFLQHMGLCSHADTVTYERMRRSVEKNSDDREENGNVIKASCVAHTDGRRKWWTCPRSNGSVPFNFINHPPLVLLPTDQGCTEDDNGLVECKQCQGEPCWRFLKEYASDEEEADPVSTDAIHKHINTEFEFLRLQPHVCDPEYLHSKNLKWVELENKDEPDLVDYWMRMAQNYGDVALVDRAHGNESVSCPDFVPPDTSTCKSQNKMRFLGLTGNDIMFYADDAPQEIVTDGRLCGLCTTEKFTYCGVDVVRLDNNDKIKKYTEVQLCGSFAHLNVNGGRCELDLDVAALAWKVYDTESACSKLYKPHDRLQLDGETLYFATDDKNTIGVYLNRLLLAYKDVFNAKEKRTQLYWFRHCVSEITEYIKDRKPALCSACWILQGRRASATATRFTRSLALWQTTLNPLAGCTCSRHGTHTRCPSTGSRNTHWRRIFSQRPATTRSRCRRPWRGRKIPLKRRRIGKTRGSTDWTRREWTC